MVSEWAERILHYDIPYGSATLLTHSLTVHVTPLRYAHSLFLGEVTNRVNERSGVTRDETGRSLGFNLRPLSASQPHPDPKTIIDWNLHERSLTRGPVGRLFTRSSFSRYDPPRRGPEGKEEPKVTDERGTKGRE